MYSKTIAKFALLFALAAAVLAGLALPTTSVSAAAQPQAGETNLENLLMREQIALNNQRARLDNSAEVSVKTQELIDKLNAQGQDTTELVAALAAFETARAEAETSHAAAAGILAAPAGFDTDGKVTDRKAALETVRTAGQALRRAHLTITQATLDLRLAVREYIETH
jgi:hypothetical protein